MKSVTYTTFSQQILGGKLLLTLIWTIYIHKKNLTKLFTPVDVADWYW